MGDVTQLTAEPDFADGDDVIPQRLAGERGRHRKRERDIGPGVVDSGPADRKGVHVVARHGETTTSFEYRQQHGEPPGIDALRRSARVAEVGVRHQRLHFDQQRAVAIDGCHDRRTRHPSDPVGQKQTAGIIDGDEAVMSICSNRPRSLPRTDASPLTSRRP